MILNEIHLSREQWWGEEKQGTLRVIYRLILTHVVKWMLLPPFHTCENWRSNKVASYKMSLLFESLRHFSSVKWRHDTCCLPHRAVKRIKRNNKRNWHHSWPRSFKSENLKFSDSVLMFVYSSKPCLYIGDLRCLFVEEVFLAYLKIYYFKLFLNN